MATTISFKNDTLITHNNATYIPSSMIPGYTGHVPSTKFLYGNTFGMASMKYLQQVRSASMGCHESEQDKDGMFPNPHLSNQVPTTMTHEQNNYPACHLTHGARYNVNFKRQEEIKLFNQLAQEHRENYKDKTGTRHPVSFFRMPVTENKNHL